MPRDLEVLRLVAEHRFLTSVHLHQWLGGSRQNLLRRLHLLFHHGYLERPTAQLDFYHRGGSRPMVYGLDRRGAGRLRRDLDFPFARLDWAGRSRSVGRLFLDHALMVAEVVTRMELACRRRGDLKVVLLDGLLPPEKTAARRRAWQWSVTLPSQERIGLAPDRVIAVEPIAGADAGESRTFFLEADRGTMPIARSNPRQSSVAKKLIAYEATWSQRIHQKRYGIGRFRTLLVTNSPSRAANILDHVRSLPRGQGLFLCSPLERLSTTENVLTAYCWDGSQHQEALFKQHSDFSC
ncbi:MAG: replication-relaxation family protein [Verrucomicrobiales bacterium]